MPAKITNDAILDAAQAEFARGGFHDTVVAEIADRAGVGKGTVYRRFGNKAKLFGAIIRRGTARLRERMKAVLNEGEDPVRILEQLLHVHFDLYEESGELIEIIVNEGLNMTGTIQPELVGEWEELQDLIGRVFRRGIREGVFVEGDPDRMGFLFHSYIWSVLRGAIVYERPLPRERYIPIMIQIFLEGLGTDRAGTSTDGSSEGSQP